MLWFDLPPVLAVFFTFVPPILGDRCIGENTPRRNPELRKYHPPSKPGLLCAGLGCYFVGKVGFFFFNPFTQNEPSKATNSNVFTQLGDHLLD